MNDDRHDERIGYLAGFLSTIAFVPQVISVWRNLPMPAESVSLATFAIFCTAVVTWLWYGVRIKKAAVIWANSVTLFLALLILAYKLIYG